MRRDTIEDILAILRLQLINYYEPLAKVLDSTLTLEGEKYLEAADNAESAAFLLNSLADFLRDVSVRATAHQIASKICNDSADDETADEYAGVNRDFSGGAL